MKIRGRQDTNLVVARYAPKKCTPRRSFDRRNNPFSFLNYNLFRVGKDFVETHSMRLQKDDLTLTVRLSSTLSSDRRELTPKPSPERRGKPRRDASNASLNTSPYLCSPQKSGHKFFTCGRITSRRSRLSVYGFELLLTKRIT